MNPRKITGVVTCLLSMGVGVCFTGDVFAADKAAKQRKQELRAAAARERLNQSGTSSSSLNDPVAIARAMMLAKSQSGENATRTLPLRDKPAVMPAAPKVVALPPAPAPAPVIAPAPAAKPAVLASASTPYNAASASPVSATRIEPLVLKPVSKSEKARDPQSVAAEIDRLIDAKLTENKVPASPLADDSEFVRRVYVDITGRIPSASAVEAFLRDASPNKRSALVDRLLASSDFGNHQGSIWRDLLIPGDTMAKVPNTQPLADWIAEGINSGRGWDVTVRQLLTAEGSTSTSPGAIFFVAHGDNKNYPQADILTRTVTSNFMGTQLQCAQCHEHPFDKRWKQEDFWGVAAFFGRVTNQAAGQKGKGGEGVITETVRQAAAGKKSGKPAARLGPGDTIVIPPDSFTNVGKAMPAKYLGGATAGLGNVQSLRTGFAVWLTDANNAFFSPAMTNRVWAQFMGHGIVNPIDDFNPVDNAPTHPELLADLSHEFAASGFDLKHLVRCMCASRTYQRSSVPVEGNKADNKWFARMDVKVMSPEVLADSLAVATEQPGLKVNLPTTARGKGGLPAKTPRDHFVRFFKPAGDGIEATDYAYGVPQALLLMNQSTFNGASPVVDRSSATGAVPAAVEQLYLAALSRKPTPAEASQAAAFIAKSKTNKDGLAGVMWTLVNRSEFVLNR